jgi:hypothetical protein
MPSQPERARARTPSSTEQVIALASLDPVALVVALGVVAALGMLVVLTISLATSGSPQGSFLSLLANYFPGFRVSWTRAPLGCGEAGAWAFGLGYVTALLYNQGRQRLPGFCAAGGRRTLLHEGRSQQVTRQSDKTLEVSRVVAHIQAVLALVCALMGGIGLFTMTAWLTQGRDPCRAANPARKGWPAIRKRVLRGGGVTHPAKRRQRVGGPCD